MISQDLWIKCFEGTFFVVSDGKPRLLALEPDRCSLERAIDDKEVR